MFIHVLDDDSLLKIFYLCQPVLLDKDEADSTQILQGGKWGPRWWYRLAQVCRRWRYLVLSLASRLGPCLVCTYDAPVGDILTHSPPLPIVLDYGDEDRELTAQDEIGILLALQCRRRVRRIRLRTTTSNLRKLVVAINGEFPMLDYLYIKPLTNDDNDLVLPETFKAPHIRYFSLRNITYSPDMFRLPPTTPRIQSVEGNGQCLRCCPSQLWRYAPLSTYFLSTCGEHGPGQQIIEDVYLHP
jgi:hypothetical protein